MTGVQTCALPILDRLAAPLFIEPKGYVFVGYSRERMTMDNMPKYEKVREFGESLGHELGYQILDEAPESRVLVLGKDKADLPIGGRS